LGKDRGAAICCHPSPFSDRSRATRSCFSCPELSRSDGEGLQGNSLETIRQMVASGLGITVLPCSALTKKHKNKRLVTLKLTKPVPGRRIGLAWRKGFSRPLVVDAMKKAIHSLKIPELKMLDKRDSD